MLGLKRAACGFLFLFTSLADGTAAAEEIYSKTTLWEDGRTVGAVAISADGNRVAFAFDDSTVRVRQADDAAATIADLAWQGGAAYFVVFSADGERLAMGTIDGAVRVWDVASARALATIQLPMPGAVWAAFNADGTRIVTAGADGAARVFEAEGGRALEVLAGHTKEVQDATFSADGAMIATASRDNTVRIWNAADGSARAVLEHDDEVNSAAFSPDGRRLVTGSDDGAAHVFDLASGREIATLRIGNAEVTDARFSPDGAHIVTGSNDQVVRVWDAAGGEPLAVLPGHLGEVRSAQFSADDARIISTAHDATGRIWTRVPSARMPDGLAGVWYPDFGDPDPQAMPPELVREICLSTPLSIREDGLIVAFEGWKPDPPQSMMHLRCGADLTCQVFAGPPQQALEPQATTAKMSVEGEIASICIAEDCRPFKRCPALTWTEEERASGYADAWEARVLRLQP